MVMELVAELLKIAGLAGLAIAGILVILIWKKNRRTKITFIKFVIQIVSAAAIFYLFIFYDPLLFSYIVSVFLLGVVIIAPLKKYINRERPFESLEVIKVFERKPTSRSFPSWHAYNVVSQGLLLAYLLNSLLIMFMVLIFAAIVSFSRIQLGVHYPTDVIFGYFIGFVGFILAIAIVAPFLMKVTIFFELLIGSQIYYQIINVWNLS